jgi:hypothetical protein
MNSSSQEDNNLERENKILREQIARLIGQKLELQRQLEDLRRTRSDVSVESLAVVVGNALQSAEQALNEAVDDGQRLTLSQLHTSFRGILMQQDDHLTLRLPLPEYAVSADQLGTLQMGFAGVPTLPVSNVMDELASALERVQVAFMELEVFFAHHGKTTCHCTFLCSLLPRWIVNEVSKYWGGFYRYGAVLAREIVARTTHLLATREQWEEENLLSSLNLLADTFIKLGKVLPHQMPSEDVKAYQRSAHTLELLTQQTGFLYAIAQVLGSIAALIERFVRKAEN